MAPLKYTVKKGDLFSENKHRHYSDSRRRRRRRRRGRGQGVDMVGVCFQCGSGEGELRGLSGWIKRGTDN